MRKYKRGSFEKQHTPIYHHRDLDDGTVSHTYKKIESHYKDFIFHADQSITVNWWNWNNCRCGNGPVTHFQVFIKPLNTVILADYAALKASPCQKHLNELKSHVSFDNFTFVSGDPDWKAKLKAWKPKAAKPKWGPGSKGWFTYKTAKGSDNII